MGFAERPRRPAIDVVTEKSISVSDSNPIAVSVSASAFPESPIVWFIDVVLEAKNCWNAPCWSPSTVNGTFENVKWTVRCCISVDGGPFGMINCAKGAPPAEKLMFPPSALMSTGKSNGKAKVAVAPLLFVVGSYAVPSVNHKSSSLSSMDLIMLSFPWFRSTASTTRLLIPSFNHVA